MKSQLMFPAVEAELLEFNALGGGLLVLGLRIVTVLALSALKRDDFSGHSSTPWRSDCRA